jgi:hypothetical protein
MPRLQRSWRRRLDGIEPPELIYSEQPLEPAGIKKKKRQHIKQLSRSSNSPEMIRRPVAKVITVLEEPGEQRLGVAAINYNKAFYLEQLRRKRIIATFARMISKIAEDLSGWPIAGDDQWSMPDLMARHLDRRPLFQCRRSREKEAVVVILDTSGSCLEQARFYSRIATAAVTAGDVQLYDAPNAGLRAVRIRQQWEPVEHRQWPFAHRTIIFFGDFDGADVVIKASKRNKVYWLCSETRYPDIRLHPWCSFTMKSFKGHYYPCVADEDFIRLLRKVR